MALRDLFIKFGIEVDGQDKLDKADNSLRGAIRSAREFGRTLRLVSGVFTGGFIGRAISGFINDQITLADRLKHNAEALGLSTDELQKYQYAADLMQVPVQQTAVALRFFNRAVGEAALGAKGSQKVFAQLGINIRDTAGNVRPTNELLFEFADRLKNTKSQAERSAFAMRLLYRNGAALLPMLQNGSEALKQAFKDVDELGGGFNQKFIDQAHETYNQMRRLKMGWRSISVAVVAELLPAINKWLESSIKTAKHLISLAKHTYGFRTALMALASGALVAALVKLFSLFAPAQLTFKSLLGLFVKYPLVLLFAAAITTLYLAFDDFYTFLEGGDSVIGRFLDTIGGYGNAANVRNQFVEIFTAIKEAWDKIKGPLGDIGSSLGKAFADSLPSIIKWGGIFLTYVVEQIDKAITYARILPYALANVFGKGTAAGRANAVSIITDFVGRERGYEKLVNTFDDLGRPTVSAHSAYVTPQAPGTVAAANAADRAQPAGFVGPPAPVEIKITNQITTTSDPQAIANATGRATKGAVKDALAEHRDTYNAVTAGSPVTGN